MTTLLDPCTTDMLWTLLVMGSLLSAAAITLLALPWSDQELARVDATFRSMGDITQESIPLRTMS